MSTDPQYQPQGYPQAYVAAPAGYPQMVPQGYPPQGYVQPMVQYPQAYQPNPQGYPQAYQPNPYPGQTTEGTVVIPPQQHYGQPAPAFQQPQYAAPPAGVVVAVPMMRQYQLYRMWSDGLCDCFNDCTSCLLAFFFPPYLFARIADKTGESTFNVAFLKYFIPWLAVVILGFMSKYGPYLGWIAMACNIIMAIFGTLLRGHVRRKFQIPGDQCEDFFTHCCCEPCAISQEDRHVQRWVMSGNPSEQQVMQQAMQPGGMSPVMAPQSPSIQGQTGHPVTAPHSPVVAIPVLGTS
jgi:Cys-rich protein (TIGR01571 family)